MLIGITTTSGRSVRGPKPRPVIDRLLEKIQKLPDSPGCWLWTGSIHATSGYGQVWSQAIGRVDRAHRLVYQTLIGPIPEGLELDHLCRTRSCVNPAHLEPVTSLTNWSRGMSLPAINARKTHCSRGHAYDQANTRYDHLGARHCITCQNIWNYKRYSVHRKRPPCVAGCSSGTDKAV